MYSKIMLPVDLAHAEKLEKALTTAADLSKHYDAPIYCVGVTAPAPSAVAHNEAEFKEKLEAFTKEQAERLGAKMIAKAAVSHDPARDLDDTLDQQVHELGIDLVVMASHVPHFAEHIFASNAGYLASHSDTSVFIVR